MMTRHDARPINLSLRHFHFPPNALASISHRMTGVLLVLTLIGWFIWLNASLLIADNFSHSQAWLTTWQGKVFLSVFWSSLAFHWLAGARHLLIDGMLNTRFGWRLRQEPAVWMMLGLWLALSGFCLLRIWL